jgi:hypothetical protein
MVRQKDLPSTKAIPSSQGGWNLDYLVSPNICDDKQVRPICLLLFTLTLVPTNFDDNPTICEILHCWATPLHPGASLPIGDQKPDKYFRLSIFASGVPVT